MNTLVALRKGNVSWIYVELNLLDLVFVTKKIAFNHFKTDQVSI